MSSAHARSIDSRVFALLGAAAGLFFTIWLVSVTSLDDESATFARKGSLISDLSVSDDVAKRGSASGDLDEHNELAKLRARVRAAREAVDARATALARSHTELEMLRTIVDALRTRHIVANEALRQLSAATSRVMRGSRTRPSTSLALTTPVRSIVARQLAHVQWPSESEIDYSQPPLIFVLSSGRTGTKLFADLLNSARNVRCFHERHPLMSHHYLRESPAISYWERYIVKVGSIITALEHPRWPKKTSYCDASNYFIKSWFDVALDHFYFAHHRPITLLVVRRRLADVLASMLDLSWFGAAGVPCGPFLYTAAHNVSMVAPLARDAQMDRADKAISHLLDVEAKTQWLVRAMRNKPGLRIVETCMESVAGNASEAEALLRRMGLEPTLSTRRQAELVHNERNEKKVPVERRTSRDAATARVRAHLLEARRRGIWTPTLPQLEQDFCAKTRRE